MTRYLHAAFELVVALGAAGFVLANRDELLAPGTHPQWRAAAILFLLVALVASAFFVNSVRHIRRGAAPKG